MGANHLLAARLRTSQSKLCLDLQELLCKGHLRSSLNPILPQSRLSPIASEASPNCLRLRKATRIPQFSNVRSCIPIVWHVCLWGGVQRVGVVYGECCGVMAGAWRARRPPHQAVAASGLGVWGIVFPALPWASLFCPCRALGGV